MNQEELGKIVAQNELGLQDPIKGKRINLQEAYLYRADLHLQYAYLKKENVNQEELNKVLEQYKLRLEDITKREKGIFTKVIRYIKKG